MYIYDEMDGASFFSWYSNPSVVSGFLLWRKKSRVPRVFRGFALLTPTGNEMPQKPEEACQAWSASYGEQEDCIQIMYNWKTDIVDQISIEGEDGSETSNWALDERISLGSTKEDIEKTYGTCSQESDDSLSYNYDSAGKKTHGENTAVILNFCLDSEGRVFNVLAIQ